MTNSMFREVAATGAQEALETTVTAAYAEANGTVGLSLGDASTWPAEVDFITYARGADGGVDETTRVAWLGEKRDDTFVSAVRTGGSPTYMPDATNLAAVVPTHRWANDVAKALGACLPGDGMAGAISLEGEAVLLSVSATEPSPVPGRTIVWVRPLVP
jgi:hypothetical protein